MGSPIQQNYSKVKKEVLSALFSGYLKNEGKAVFNVSEIVSSYGFSLAEVGNYLLQNSWIKNVVFKPKDLFAAISVKGIKEVEQDWLDHNFSKIIATLVVNGNKKSNLLEILEFDIKDFQIIEDIARAFAAIGFAEFEITQNSILIVLNERGYEYYKGSPINNF